MSTERPILFSAPMVRALLREQNPKTVTRRLVKPMPGKQREWLGADGINAVPHGEIVNGGWQMHHPKAGTSHGGASHPHDSPLGWIRSPYGAPGDRLWVRETWADADSMYQGHTNDVPSVVAYRADKNAIQFDAKKPSPVPSWDLKRWDFDALTWRPSIHMPRALSRITLEVTSVRVERLQDITEEDARAEGVEDRYYRTAFAELWDGINGDRVAWESNPWVWVVGFKRVAAEARLR